VWYFTPYYSILRAVPPLLHSQFPGVLAMGAAVIILFFLPWLDRSPVKSIRYKGALYKSWLAVFIVAFFVLGYLGPGPTQPLGPVRAVARQRGARDGGRPHSHGGLLPVLPADALVFQTRQVQAGARPGDVGGALMFGRKKLLIVLLALPALASFSSRASES